MSLPRAYPHPHVDKVWLAKLREEVLAETLNAYRAAAGYSDHEKAALFHDTAARFYRL